MKIAFITDTHLGVRNGSKVFRDMFRDYYKNTLIPYLKNNDIQHVVHLGDFWDDRTKINLQDLNYAIEEFIPLIVSNDIKMYIVAGNHDCYFKSTNKINSLSIFRNLENNFTIIDDDLLFYLPESVYCVHDFYLCPWINEENSEKLFEQIKDVQGKNSILCGHFEINGALMYKNSIGATGGIDKDKFKNFYKVMSGHFHHPSTYGNVEYIGALFHYNWMDYNDWRGFLVYDGKTGEFERIENTQTLFREYQYEEVKNRKDLDVGGKIVRLVINEEYNKIELKEFINSLESKTPASLDVVDNTILDGVLLETQEKIDVDSKELEEYFDLAIDTLEEDENNKKAYRSIIKHLYDEAKKKQFEIE